MQPHLHASDLPVASVGAAGNATLTVFAIMIVEWEIWEFSILGFEHESCQPRSDIAANLGIANCRPFRCSLVTSAVSGTVTSAPAKFLIKSLTSSLSMILGSRGFPKILRLKWSNSLKAVLMPSGVNAATNWRNWSAPAMAAASTTRERDVPTSMPKTVEPKSVHTSLTSFSILRRSITVPISATAA